MSFILDALKKSEMERQRQTVPGLMDSRPAQRRSGLPLWAIALGVLLGVNLLVLTFVLTRKSSSVAPAPRPAAASPAIATAPKADAAASAAEHFSPLDTAPVYAPEIPVAPAETPVPVPVRPSTVRAPALDGLGSSGAHSGHQPDPVLTDEDSRADNREVLPTISEISLTGSQALPELHLDVHVYATKPAERFVYINMRKYHEGGTLQEGPTVERIRRDGVVLNYQGLRFILPRQP